MTTAFILIVAAFSFGFFATIGAIFGQMAAVRCLNMFEDWNKKP